MLEVGAGGRLDADLDPPPWHHRLLDPRRPIVEIGGRGHRLPSRPQDPIDDTIQAALRDLDPEVGGVVRVPPGTHVVDHVDLDADARPVTFDLRGVTLVKAHPADGGTVTHMFASPYGTSERLRVVGGTFDLTRDGFTFGQTVSAFYGVRPDDWGFYGCRFMNGIEEGLKLYMARRIRVVGCDFEDLADNGVQIHTVAQMPTGPGHKADRVAGDVQILSSSFVRINDGFTRGTRNGQGVAVSSPHASLGVEDVLVHACRADRCIRGFWAEFNRAGVVGQNIRFVDNRVRRSEFHGMGFVGVRGGSMVGNIITDIGELVPRADTSSEVFGLQVSGSANNYSEDILVDRNVIAETRTGRASRDPEVDAFMEYGIVAKSCRRVTITGRNKVSGALKRPLWVQRSVEDSDIQAPAPAN